MPKEGEIGLRLAFDLQALNRYLRSYRSRMLTHTALALLCAQVTGSLKST